MAKLSLNQSAKYAGVAKKTLLERLNHKDFNKKLSGEKNERGHWEIDEAELDRVFAKPHEKPQFETVLPPLEKAAKTSGNSDLLIEVATLREQLKSAETEKTYLADKIEDLRARAERAEQKEDELRRLLPPPPQSQPETPPRRFFGLLKG